MKNYIEKQIEEKTEWASRWFVKATLLFAVVFFSFLIFAFTTQSPKWISILFEQKDWIFHSDFENIAWVLIGIMIFFGILCIPALKKMREVGKLKIHPGRGRHTI